MSRSRRRPEQGSRPRRPRTRGTPGEPAGRWPRVFLAGVLALGVSLAGACTPDDQRTESLDVQGPSTRAQLPSEVVEALDAGSEAYRADDFEGALEHYTRAAELAPEQASGWFGIYMANEALGNTEAAEAALETARELAPGASIIHPTAEDTLP